MNHRAFGFSLLAPPLAPLVPRRRIGYCTLDGKSWSGPPSQVNGLRGLVDDGPRAQIHGIYTFYDCRTGREVLPDGTVVRP